MKPGSGVNHQRHFDHHVFPVNFLHEECMLIAGRSFKREQTLAAIIFNHEYEDEVKADDAKFKKEQQRREAFADFLAGVLVSCLLANCIKNT